jgi:hypothetical protein
MNKKQLLVAIAALALDLKFVLPADVNALNVNDLETLHAKLTAEKEALEQANDNSKVAIDKQAKVVLEFKAPYKRYSNGDIAGFSADVSKNILALKPGVAVLYKTKVEEE